ncbi:MAG: TonB-dependent receptor [Bacteroidota bacterium]
MKEIYISIFLLIKVLIVTAQTGVIKGTVTDAKTNEFLIGTTIVIKGTTQGAITDFDGNYLITNVRPGNHTLVVSFISYDFQEFQIDVKSGEETVVNAELFQATLEIESVEVVAKATRESETILLIDQKKASGIQENIGSKRMATLGVSDAAAATSKISGVTRNESTGDVYIRGLGDRYLTTTMNGLPIPSDDVEKKNIDLNLFSADIIGNIGIYKTFSVETYADQSSGSINIGSKIYSDKIEVETTTESGSNIFLNGIWSNFKTTQNYNDVTFGFYKQPYATVDAITNQSWNAEDKSFPLGVGLSFLAGKKLRLFNSDLSLFATLSHSNDFEYQTGIYKKYRSNVLDNLFNDVEMFNSKNKTTGLLNFTYDINDSHTLNLISMMVLKISDKLYEQGRNGEGYVFDQDPQEEGAFVRDQNLKQTRLYINQLLGSHKFSDKNQMRWGGAYNMVDAEEPNRIRNEVNIIDEHTVQFAHVGDFQQRKSFQNIEDIEFNGYLKDELKFVDEEKKKLKLILGGNFRNKQRDFNSLFIGVRAKGVQVKSIDNLDEALLNDELYASGELIIKERKPDVYKADLIVYAGYVNANVELDKFLGTFGVRYEQDQIKVDWDVANYVGRKGNSSNNYNNFLPALNMKYQLTEKSSLRLAAGKTITLPEFKELSPFEYVSHTGRVTRGNPDLKHSENYNFDLKWEVFPDSRELISVTGFYKMINNPINLAQTRGSSGNFIYENTGEKANVYGVEMETRLNIIKAQASGLPRLNMIINATKMWFIQDLFEEFQYNNKTETNLQGASGFILNGALTYTNNKEKKFVATITGNYSSDKIFALGAPEDFENSASLFNNEIIEKGFTTLDLIVSKKISNRISVKFSAKNLLNPKIEQTQEIKPLSGEASNEVVSSYKNGINLALSLKINLN